MGIDTMVLLLYYSESTIMLPEGAVNNNAHINTDTYEDRSCREEVPAFAIGVVRCHFKGVQSK